ncbi:putative Sec1 [Giardia muris]|uniref:Putative Sec1 n=1 Tax=Giardia muris TaxID=5742 RepID=A0A4Z1SVM1_GIAMU|nr:putative Sec1 [Giardia muris]|eukprot:TNJ29824.1 putative Sec1 [Giardia muris]
MAVCERLRARFSEIIAGSPRGAATWHVLVVDGAAKMALSRLFGAADLLRLNIALIVDIDAQKQPIPDAAAIYACRPTVENARLLFQHIGANFYGSYEFISIAGPSQLHMLLYQEFKGEPSRGSRLLRIVEFPMDLALITRDFFTPNGELSEERIIGTLYSYISALTGGLESDGLERVLRMPQIYTCGPASRTLLNTLLERLQGENVICERLPGHILVLADREADPTPLFYHPYTYQGLLEEFELFSPDDRGDPLFDQIGALHFTRATEEVNLALRGIKERYGTEGERRHQLGSLTFQMDELAAQKANCEKHTDLCEKILQRTEGMELSKLHALEQELPNGTRDVISYATSATHTMHIVRLLICLLLTSGDNLKGLSMGTRERLSGPVQQAAKLLDKILAQPDAGETAQLLQDYTRLILNSIDDTSIDSPDQLSLNTALAATVNFVRKGINALTNRGQSLAHAFVDLVTKGEAGPLYNTAYDFQTQEGTGTGVITNVGLFIHGLGSLEEAARISEGISLAFEGTANAPAFSYGCISLKQGSVENIIRKSIRIAERHL